MSFVHSLNIRSILGLSLFITFASFFLWPATSMENLGHKSNPIDRLRVAIKQTKISPPTITSTVFNDNPYPVTILVYNSPLDTAAPTIGLLTITPDGSAQPLELPRIQLRREWPPKTESLVQIGPGESQSAEIVLKEFITSQLEKKASVVLKGNWHMVWNKQKDEITVEMLEQAQQQPNPDMFTGAFSTESLEITVA
ncbi:putative secreted protein [Trichoderma ghanense]|uniref:Secreted protein n=1 Tax=Trichoderma ghanense TaxID=65468 RepID=A0ABY2HKL0_9HYPO